MAGIFKKISRFTASLIIVLFGFNSLSQPGSLAQVAFLPMAGSMVTMTARYDPVVIKGMQLYPNNPFKFDFIVDAGQANPSIQEIKEQSHKLISFFLASLTTPEKEMWVNLSPFEKERIIPKTFGQTEMGKELLAQDYLLKQIMATALYPERQLGQQFWARVYSEAQAKFGTTNVPVSTFNKVWILPDRAVVYENAQSNSVFVVQSTLKVMLEQDYLALKKNVHVEQSDVSALGSQVIREIVIPALEKEVNEGKNFAPLRQVYQSLILAAWYKKNLKDNIIAKAYIDRDKIKGVDVADKEVIQKIYKQYLRAYRKGVYSYIKEEMDPATQSMIPRKYFSGGLVMAIPDMAMTTDRSSVANSIKGRNLFRVGAGATVDQAMAIGFGINPLKKGASDELPENVQDEVFAAIEAAISGQQGQENPEIDGQTIDKLADNLEILSERIGVESKEHHQMIVDALAFAQQTERDMREYARTGSVLSEGALRSHYTQGLTNQVIRVYKYLYENSSIDASLSDTLFIKFLESIIKTHDEMVSLFKDGFEIPANSFADEFDSKRVLSPEYLLPAVKAKVAAIDAARARRISVNEIPKAMGIIKELPVDVKAIEKVVRRQPMVLPALGNALSATLSGALLFFVSAAIMASATSPLAPSVVQQFSHMPVHVHVNADDLAKELIKEGYMNKQGEALPSILTVQRMEIKRHVYSLSREFLPLSTMGHDARKYAYEVLKKSYDLAHPSNLIHDDLLTAAAPGPPQGGGKWGNKVGGIVVEAVVRNTAQEIAFANASGGLREVGTGPEIAGLAKAYAPLTAQGAALTGIQNAVEGYQFEDKEGPMAALKRTGLAKNDTEALTLILNGQVLITPQDKSVTPYTYAQNNHKSYLKGDYFKIVPKGYQVSSPVALSKVAQRNIPRAVAAGFRGKMGVYKPKPHRRVVRAVVRAPQKVVEPIVAPTRMRTGRNPAMISTLEPRTKGGIDLALVNLNTLGGGVRTAFSDPKQLQMLLDSDGLLPVIYKVQPMTMPMVNMLLGFNASAVAHA